MDMDDIKTYNPINEYDLIELWKDRLDVNSGDSKEKALQAFREFTDRSRTCARCQEDDYAKFCPMAEACKQIDEEVAENGNKSKESREIGIQETESYFTS